MKRVFKLAASALFATAIGASGCCDEASLNMSRISGFLEGVVDLRTELDLSTFASLSFSGTIGSWAHVPSLSQYRIEADLSDVEYSSGSVEYDVDFDGADERIRVVETVKGSGQQLLFASWKGDEYTLDDDVCYLGWVEGGVVKLAASPCGEDAGTMFCDQLLSGATDPDCERCNAAGLGCVDCDMSGDLNDCLPEEKGGVDLDVDIDADAGTEVDSKAEGEAGTSFECSYTKTGKRPVGLIATLSSMATKDQDRGSSGANSNDHVAERTGENEDEEKDEEDHRGFYSKISIGLGHGWVIGDGKMNPLPGLKRIEDPFHHSPVFNLAADWGGGFKNLALHLGIFFERMIFRASEPEEIGFTLPGISGGASYYFVHDFFVTAHVRLMGLMLFLPGVVCDSYFADKYEWLGGPGFGVTLGKEWFGGNERGVGLGIQGNYAYLYSSEISFNYFSALVLLTISRF